MATLRSTLAPALFVSFLLVACQPADTGGRQEGTPSAREAAVEEIRQLDRDWVRMVQEKDTTGIVELYVDGAGRVMPPESPSVVGQEALFPFWSATLNLPHLEFGPDTIIVSESGDLAADIGWATYRVPGADADVQGKYVVVWVRQNGEWKVLADIFNTNAPQGGD